MTFTYRQPGKSIHPYMTKVAPKCTGMTVFIQLKKFSSWVNRNSLLINKDYPETN